VRTDRRHTWAPAAALAVAGVLACGGDSEQATGPAGGGEKPGWTVEATPSPGKEGAAYPNKGAVNPQETDTLPADFPEDVPQYPGAEVQSARTRAGEGMSVSLTSADDVDKVASYYADTFAARGWATDIRRTPKGQAIFADKGNRTASTLVRSEGGSTRVEVIVVAR
jgi:hypothetical protein